MGTKEAYASLNMGAGFVIFAPSKDVDKTIKLAKKKKVKAYHVGQVKKGPRQVVIEPLSITYKESSLKLRS